jgi:hypothetical protein
VHDLEELAHMQSLVNDGVRPAQAASLVKTAPAAGGLQPGPSSLDWENSDPAWDGPHKAATTVLVVPGGSPQARSLARIASRLDADAAMGMLSDSLIRNGVAATWRDVCQPVFHALGARWARTGDGIDVEHVLSEATIEALRAYRAFLPKPLATRPVLMACASSDEHTIALHVLGAALTERRTPTLMLGSRSPAAALASATQRSGAGAVFVWRQTSRPVEIGEDLALMFKQPSAVRVVAGGQGWDDIDLPHQVIRVPDLTSAVRVLTVA